MQVQRLEPQFLELQRVLDAQNAIVSSAAGAASAEHVLVFETNGPPAEFFATVAALPDLEWLVDHEEKVEPDEYFKVKGSGRKLTACIYMVLFNQRALQELLSLWKLYKTTARMPDGHGAWSAVFRCLRTIRRWGPEDRLREAGLLQHALDLDLSGPLIPVEIELWARTAELRDAAEARVSQLVEEAYGGILDRAFLPEIRYHALLAELPRQYLNRLLVSKDVDLIQADEIYLLRPTPQCSTEVDVDRIADGPASARDVVGGTPACALLDGLPVENHPQLRGHLIVDDPDGWAAHYPVAERKHGTAMASLIVHGDQAEALPPLDSPIYVRPIIRYSRGREQAPRDRLWLDLVHQAVRRIVAKDGPFPPVAPSVRIINLSVGDCGRPFIHEPSPLARLLDWLAWKHHVLFVVSAGNYKTELPSECGDDGQALRHAFGESRHRRLLSPAETLNGLTVGALNSDNAGPPLQRGSRPIPERPDLPAIYSAQGRGIRRGVKPDLLAPGGRQLFQRKLPTVGSPWVPTSFQQVGHVVAVPAPLGSKPTTWFSGTSNAAALTSRAAIVVNRAIEQLLASEEGRWLREVPAAVLVKAMVVHTAEWHEDTLSFAQGALQGLLDPSRGKDQLSGILGYGVLRAARGVVCAPERATAIGGGILAADQRAVHRFPIPKCLHLHRAWRRLTATLAWFSPINPADRRYRVARLQMDVPKKGGSPLLVDGGQVHADAAIRGTVQHVILERAKAVIDAGDDAELEIGVTCSEDAPSLSEPIPYALAVSLEIAAGTNVLVYEQVAARLRVQARARVSPPRVDR